MFDGPAQIDEIHAIDEQHALVVGRVQSSVNGIVLLNVVTGDVQDRFIALRMAVSPNERYVAFVKVFPLRFTEGLTAQYVIYDTAIDPAENRHSRVPSDNVVDVGIPVYPPGAQNLPGDNYGQSVTHTWMSDIFWDADGRRLAFAVREGNSEASIVRVDLSSGVHVAEVSNVALDVLAVGESASCSTMVEREAIAGRLWVESIEFHAPDMASVQFRYPASCSGPSSLEVGTFR